jgi:hypothetical protein
MIKQLDVYDFDETLVRAPSYTNKKAVEKAYPNLKFDTPYSFYDHAASLCEDTHHIQLIEPVYEFWKEATNDPETITALVTHRVGHLAEEVKQVLNDRGVSMDFYFFYGRTIPKFKAIEEMLSQFPTIEKVRIFDDSYEQLGIYLAYIDLIKETDSKVEYEIWAVDKTKIFKVESMRLSDSKKITLI